jgi:hypothetical protein
MPSVGQLLKTVGFGGFFGGIAGLATASPFIPKSWSPQTQTPDREQLEPERSAGRQRDGVRTNFKHPLLMPVALYSTGSLIAPGLLGGAVTA